MFVWCNSCDTDTIPMDTAEAKDMFHDWRQRPICVNCLKTGRVRISTDANLDGLVNYLTVRRAKLRAQLGGLSGAA